jgi:quinol monooxygenase YgiN
MQSTPSLPDCRIVELRQYTLHPGQREVLIELFDREFLETQEREGMRVIGQFRDLDQPDLFVWLRGFADMQARRQALEAFYGGPVWAAHRDAANATMADSDNVLLLHPAWTGAADGLPADRAAMDASGAAPGLLDATVFYLKEPATPELLAYCRERMDPTLRAGGARHTAWYASDTSPNSFPRLPVREGEHVLLGLALFGDAAAFDAFAQGGTWQRDVAPGLAPWLARAPEAHRLQPTGRSALHA